MRGSREALLEVISRSREVGSAVGHVLNRRFFYSEGVQEFVEVARAYWLLDLMATEACLAAALAWQDEGLSKNRLLLQAFSSLESAPCLAWVESLADPSKRLWKSVLGHLDFPEGRWELRLCVKDWHPLGVVVVCTLPSESYPRADGLPSL